MVTHARLEMIKKKEREKEKTHTTNISSETSEYILHSSFSFSGFETSLAQ